MEVLKDWLVTFGRIASKPLPQTFITESGESKRKTTQRDRLDHHCVACVGCPKFFSE